MNISAALKMLEKSEQIKGSMVITHDGILVASEMAPDLETEAFSAFCSSLGLTILNSFKKLDLEPFSRYILHTEKNKLFIIKIDELYLIIVADSNINLKQFNVELYQVESLIRKTGRL